MEALEFVAPWDKTEAESEEVSLRLLNIEVTGLCCGPEAASWVSRFLGEECRLVQHREYKRTVFKTGYYRFNTVWRTELCGGRGQNMSRKELSLTIILIMIFMRRQCAGLPPDLPSDHSTDVCRCDGLHADNLRLSPGPEVTAADPHRSRG